MEIIVTVCDKQKSFQYDFEVPILQSIETLTNDIVEVLKEVNVFLEIKHPLFYVPRLKRVLNRAETLGQAGVWNGDCLVIVEHG